MPHLSEVHGFRVRTSEHGVLVEVESIGRVKIHGAGTDPPLRFIVPQSVNVNTSVDATVFMYSFQVGVVDPKSFYRNVNAPDLHKSTQSNTIMALS